MGRKSRQQIALGQAVRKLRGNCGISQEALADRARVHRTYVGGIERGERNVSFTNLVRVAEALDVPLSGLVAEYERELEGHS